MRKIIASEMITVDGFFAGEDGELDWFVQDEELNTVALDLLHSVDAILYGKATYEMMAGFWSHATGSFADRTNTLQKIVFSTTLKETLWGEWKNAKPVNGDIAQEVAKLKQQTGKDMVIYGSGSIVQALTNLGLIDEIVNSATLMTHF
jgi:dihydrofolate reductase